jgi:TonB family protein
VYKPARCPPLRRGSCGALLGLSISVAALVAAPDEAAAKDITPFVSPSDWRLQMVERIDSSKTFPTGGYCREGIVKVSFMIDRAGNLLSSGIAESSNVPAFDVEALAILKRAQPFPPPPEELGGPFVSLAVPMHFRQQAEGAAGEKRLYLNLRSDATLTLNGAAIQNDGLDRTLIAMASKDKSAWIFICSDEDVSPEQLGRLAERVKAFGLKFIVVPRPVPESD